MRWLGIAVGLPIGVTLLAVSLSTAEPLRTTLLYITYGVMSISFVLIISPYGLQRLPTFDQIRIKDIHIQLDTFPLRYYLADEERAKQLPIPELKLTCDVEFFLSFGEGGIKNKIGIVLPQGMRKELASLLNWSLFSTQDYPLTKTEEQRIELRRGLQSFQTENVLYLQVKPTLQVNQRLDLIADKLERGDFTIEFITAMGNRKRYKPRKETR